MIPHLRLLLSVNRYNRKVIFLLLLLMAHFQFGYAQYQMENLNRGVVAISQGGSKVFVSWRWLGTENDGITFNLYRNGTKVNSTPITVCNYTDNAGSITASYTVKAIIGGVEQAASEAVAPWDKVYKTIPLKIPPSGTTPKGEAYTYSPNDCSVGDVDGDGVYEIFVKWDPSNSKDNSQSGYTGNVYIDCYSLAGKQLWRIDLGRNIRAGAHYTQFLVYDFDGDGLAEMACKTADGTKDGKGVVIGNPAADYRNSSGYVLSGPEFLTVFNGKTGAAMATANYTPARGTVSSWGDSYGNRVDRFIATVAYLDGKTPSMVFGRGYYTRLVRVAWDWKGGKLTQRWIFDSNTSGNGSYASMGNHQMTVGDVDGDGKQEVCNGASAIDDNGNGLYANGLGHGDALHMTDMDPDRAGQEVWQCHEEPGKYGNYGLEFRDAKTGKPLWGLGGGNQGDIGRCMAGDIDPRHKGYEVWGAGKTYNCKGTIIATSRPSECFRVYWDGDLQTELLDGVKLDKWNYTSSKTERIATLSDAAYGSGASCNTTKATPNLAGDIFGDWREEIILHSTDNKNLLIYTTTVPSAYTFRTLMHDAQYRVAISWQNSAYNQPPHLSYYLGSDMTAPAKPNIAIAGGVKDCNNTINGGAYVDACGTCVGGTTGKTACVVDCFGVKDGKAVLDKCGICVGGTTGKAACTSGLEGEDFCTATGVAESKNEGFIGDGYLNLDNAVGTSASWYIVADEAITTQLGVRYANGGTAARGITIAINGTQQGSLLGKATGGFTTWEVEYVTVNLKKGSNLFTLSSTSADGAPNIDVISFTSTKVRAGGCVTDCNGQIGGDAFTDECGKCVGGTTGLTACEQDCNGDWGGSAVNDNCGACIGGKTNNLPCKGSLEAEEACSVEGIQTESKNEGFYGTGYINTDNILGASATWKLSSASDQTVTLAFRYANGGTANRDGQVYVNGSSVTLLSMPPTDSWTAWKFASVNVTLKAGENEVKVSAITADGLANIDVIYFSAGVSAAGCVVTGIETFQNLTQDLYPNPTQSKVYMLKVDEWKIVNLEGEVLQSGQKDTELDLSNYPAGMYYLVTKEKTHKVFKK
ncbi:MAG: carbohydrate-binding protein [Sporocytophaga sp.]|nr:carbohydrate-binding protein [Sporocytophaga sp.]